MPERAPNPTATTRMSIRWENKEPEENTSTLVLTAPSGIFVDLRILVDWLPAAWHAHVPQPSAAVDWAFAGISCYESRASNTNLAENTWKHWIDSRTSDALNVYDAGVSSPMPDGDTLERGEMKDTFGILRGYEEVWRDVRVDPACAAVFVRFRSDSEAAARGVSMYPGTINPEDVCGMLVRVGGWCQGVLRDVNGFTAERWQFSAASSNDGSGAWVPVFRSGQGDIPCVRACSDSDLTSPNALELSTSDGLWKCVELYEGKTMNPRASTPTL